jgi:hypothetical protein
LAKQEMKRILKANAFDKHSNEDNRGLRRSAPKLIYLFGDPESYIAMGKFMVECGRQMRRPGPFHRHFRDYLRSWTPAMVDVVVERPEAEKRKNTAANKQIQAIATKRGS